MPKKSKYSHKYHQYKELYLLLQKIIMDNFQYIYI